MYNLGPNKMILCFLLVTNLLTVIVLAVLYLQFKKMRLKHKGVAKENISSAGLDPLTRLPNRISFFEYCRRRIINAKKNNQMFALLFLDIDNFRGLKDSFGYALGDALLFAVAERLMTVMDNNKESLARLGSDHFTIMLENASSQKNIEEVVSKILQLMGESFHLLGHEIATSASIGISIYPNNGDEVEQLLKCAGIARHQAKRLGNNAYSYYHQETGSKLSAERTLELHLRKAILNKEFRVCYQPKVDAQTRKIIGAEALLEWNNPLLGKVSAAQFIPIAEQTGLIIPIGRWILNKACVQTHQWHQQGFPDLSIAINLSAYQFRRKDIVEQISTAILESGLDPKLLELEITESLVMENLEKSLLMLKVLKAMGIQIAIDDFGTGHSSLSQITQLPVDSLKIDQAFVKKIHTKAMTEEDSAIIRIIINMAKQLKLKVIAEGVETECQFDFLKNEGCDLLQGYLFSAPLPAEAFTELLKKNWVEYPL